MTELPTPKGNYGSFKRICYWSRKAKKSLAVAVYNHYKRIQQLGPKRR